jgi:hypothetical protein
MLSELPCILQRVLYQEHFTDDLHNSTILLFLDYFFAHDSFRCLAYILTYPKLDLLHSFT